MTQFSSAELEQACWSSHSWAEAVKSLSTTHVECRNEQVRSSDIADRGLFLDVSFVDSPHRLIMGIRVLQVGGVIDQYLIVHR